MKKPLKKTVLFVFSICLLTVTAFVGYSSLKETQRENNFVNTNENGDGVENDDINWMTKESFEKDYAKQVAKIKNAKVDFEFEYSMEHYFKNLYYNSPKNYQSCGFVSFAQYLSYFDTFYNDSIIPERYEEGQERDSALKPLSSPGVDKIVCGSQTKNSNFVTLTNERHEANEKLNDEIDKDDQADEKLIEQLKEELKIKNEAFLTFVNNRENYYYDFQVYLMRLYNLNSTHTSSSCSMSSYQSILDELCKEKLINFKPKYEQISFNDLNIDAKPNDKDVVKRMEDYIKEKIDAGFPVMVHVGKPLEDDLYNSYHSIVAYAYDKNGIYANFGWGEDSTYLPVRYEGYYVYEAGVIDVSNMPHTGAANYFFTENGIIKGYCGCKKPYSSHSKLIFNTTTLKYDGRDCENKIEVTTSGEYKFSLVSEYGKDTIGFRLTKTDTNNPILYPKSKESHYDDYFYYTFKTYLTPGIYTLITWIKPQNGNIRQGTIDIDIIGRFPLKIYKTLRTEKKEDDNNQIFKLSVEENDTYEIEVRSNSYINFFIRDNANSIVYEESFERKHIYLTPTLKAGNYYLWLQSQDQIFIAVTGKSLTLKKVYLKSSEKQCTETDKKEIYKLNVKSKADYRIELHSDYAISGKLYAPKFVSMYSFHSKGESNKDCYSYVKKSVYTSTTANLSIGTYYLELNFTYSVPTKFVVVLEGGDATIEKCDSSISERIGKNEIKSYTVRIERDGKYNFYLNTKSNCSMLEGKLFDSSINLLDATPKSKDGKTTEFSTYLSEGIYTFDILNKSTTTIDYTFKVAGEDVVVEKKQEIKYVLTKTSEYLVPKQKSFYKIDVNKFDTYRFEFESCNPYTITIRRYETNYFHTFESSKNDTEYDLSIELYLNIGTYYIEINYSNTSSGSFYMYHDSRLNPSRCNVAIDRCDVGETESYSFEITKSGYYQINVYSDFVAKIYLRGNNGFTNTDYTEWKNNKAKFNKTYYIPAGVYSYEVSPVSYGCFGKFMIAIIDKSIKLTPSEKVEEYYEVGQKHYYDLTTFYGSTYKARVTSPDASLNGKEVVLYFYDQLGNIKMSKLIKVSRDFCTFSGNSSIKYEVSVEFKDPTNKGKLCLYIDGGDARLESKKATRVTTNLSKNNILLYKIVPKETGIINFDVLGQYEITTYVYNETGLEGNRFDSYYSNYFCCYKSSIEYYMYSEKVYYIEIRLTKPYYTSYIDMFAYDLSIDLKQTATHYTYCPKGEKINRVLTVKKAGYFSFVTTAKQNINAKLYDSKNNVISYKKGSYNGTNYYIYTTIYLEVGTYTYETYVTSSSAPIRVIVERMG